MLPPKAPRNTQTAPIQTLSREAGDANPPTSPLHPPASLKPTAVAKKKKKPWKKPDAGEDGDKPSATFRDRAKERREGTNADFAESEMILERLNVANAENEEVSKEDLYQQSKYLGGDLEHTHLVKGLDFALLQKVRSELEAKEKEAKAEQDAEEYVESTMLTSHLPSSKFKSKLAEQVYNLAIIQPKEKPPLKNELFFPGRMAFAWNLSDGVAADDVPTTVIRSRTDVRMNVPQTSADTDIVMEKITQIIEDIRVGTRGASTKAVSAEEKKRLRQKEREEKFKQMEEARRKAIEEGGVMEQDEEGDDIFADAGRDYVAEAKQKPPPSQHDPSASPKKPASYFANSNTEPKDPTLDSTTKEPTSISSILHQSASLYTHLKTTTTTQDPSPTPTSKPTQPPQPSAPTIDKKKYMPMQAFMSSGSMDPTSPTAGDDEGGDFFEYDYDEYGDMDEDDDDGGKGGEGESGGKKKGADVDRFNKDFQKLDKLMTKKYGETIAEKRKGGAGGGGGKGGGKREGGPAKRLRL
ncbi:hypothetical protein HDV05_000993 [Chytridiales sp. JEL 0842]|nr:hypothetical protein HDV05_000993 [Chytridiales sp. JEL 0842]